MSEPLQFNTPVINAEGNIMTLSDLAGGGGGGTSPQLLWTNPDTTVDFASQTISDIDLEGFTHLLILFQNSKASVVYEWAITTIKETDADFTDYRECTAIIKVSSASPTASDSAKKACYIRVVKASSSTKTIYFGGGLTTASSVTADNCILPYKVYGMDLSSILS